MSDIQVGDRVRVSTEGEVKYPPNDYITVDEYSYSMETHTVELLERRAPKIGDVIAASDIDALPVATLIEDQNKNHYLRTNTGGWRWAGDGKRVPLPRDAFTIRFIPD